MQLAGGNLSTASPPLVQRFSRSLGQPADPPLNTSTPPAQGSCSLSGTCSDTPRNISQRAIPTSSWILDTYNIANRRVYPLTLSLCPLHGTQVMWTAASLGTSHLMATAGQVSLTPGTRYARRSAYLGPIRLSPSPLPLNTLLDAK